MASEFPRILWILEDRIPVQADNLLAWVDFMEDFEHRVVAYDTIDRPGCAISISTVFLGIDPRRGLFETMVFGGALDLTCRRYATWEQAEAGHKALLKQVMLVERGGSD